MKTVAADRPFPSPIPPVKTRQRVVKVLRPRPGAELRAVCLNQELTAAWTHWHPAVDGKVRCNSQLNEEDCTDCPETDRRWYAYIPVLYLSSGRVACFELTHQAAADCPQLSTKRVPLRGQQIVVGRHGKGPFGRCYAKVEPFHRNIALPPAEDMEALLRMIFGPCELGVPSRRRGRKEKGE
jgi:hypothetical protein